MIASCPFQLLSHLMGIRLSFKCLQLLDNNALSFPFVFHLVFIFHFMCLSVVPARMWTTRVPKAHGRQERVSVSWNPLELELLWMVVSSYVGAGH